MKHEWWMTASDQSKIYVKKWFKPSKKPKAIVQLAHGMAEHVSRYDAFATYLIHNDIFVYGNDHRGHGRTTDQQGQLGYLSDEDGFKKVTSDMYELSRIIKEKHPHTPLFLLGHSMGSFLARKYIQDYSKLIDGVILAGTGYHTKGASQITKWMAEKLPPKEESYLLNMLVFQAYNRKIPDNKTKFDWLSRDHKSVQAYIEDPYSGFIPTARFFYDLMSGLQMIQDNHANARIHKDLPMLIVSGDADPVGHYGKGIWKTAKQYNDLGLTDVQVMLFEGARHELLNEINQREVYEALYDWIRHQNIEIT